MSENIIEAENKFRFKHKRPGDEPAPAVSDNVHELGAHEAMSVEETLAIVSRDLPTNILIAFTYEDDDGDTDFCIRSSELSRADALFLWEKVKHNLIHGTT